MLLKLQLQKLHCEAGLQIWAELAELPLAAAAGKSASALDLPSIIFAGTENMMHNAMPPSNDSGFHEIGKYENPTLNIFTECNFVSRNFVTDLSCINRTCCG